MCGLGVRARSIAAGSLKTSGSWFAAAIARKTVWPFARDWTPRSCATVTLRAIVRAGPTTRMSSSIAVSQRSGCARSSSASAGRSSRSASELSIRLVVVSWPPNRSSVQAPELERVEPADLAVHHRGEQVPRRLRALALDQRAEERVELAGGGDQRRLVELARREREDDRGEVGRPAEEAVAVLGLRAQQTGDHARGDRAREAFVELDRVARAAREGGDRALDDL